MPKTVTGYPPDSDFDRAAKAGLGIDDAIANADASVSDDNENLDSAQDRAATTPDRLMQLAQAADQQALNYANMQWRRQWEQNYKSFRSEYVDTSKYKSADYRHRSKIFRPKTRTAVVKDLAGAAQTLFASVSSISVQPGDDTQPAQVANAELLGALVDYRLDRTSGKNAIPWFLTAMGAREDCQIAGICVSKSYWDFKEDLDPKAIDKDGRRKRIVDKPAIDIYPPENVGMDPAAHWTDPVQTGAYFYVRCPMHIQEVRERMSDPRVPWKPVADEDIWTKARVKEFETANVRRAREGGIDRLDNQGGYDKELDIVWVYEWCIRTHDGDWNFWTLSTLHLLSDPVKMEQAYPWKNGERPFRVGYGNLEAHRVVPQSQVETLRPLQQEINDITNLRLDNLKMVIQPVALVKRGRKIDTDGLKRRYPVLFVDDPKADVEWDRPPDSAASSFAETSRLDTDFDDLAGTFNGGSVANNRQVGETVGGMRLMAGAANAVSEFYVRLWVETWVEPVVADLAKLEAYYEDDVKILALAQKRAPSMLKAGISDVTDELLNQEVVVRVAAGVGSPDPMQKMAKLSSAVQLLTEVLKASKKFQSGELQLQEQAWINEIMGAAGQRDGFDRFFMTGPPMPQPGEQPQPGMDPVEAASKQADRQNKLDIAKLHSKTKLASDLIKHRAAERDQHRGHRHENKKNFMDVMLEALKGHQADKHANADRAAGGFGGQPGLAPPPGISGPPPGPPPGVNGQPIAGPRPMAPPPVQPLGGQMVQ